MLVCWCAGVLVCHKVLEFKIKKEQTYAQILIVQVLFKIFLRALPISIHKMFGGDDMIGKELNRWFYTALTRAQQQVYLVGFEGKLLG